jgi:acetyl esterase/lipase
MSPAGMQEGQEAQSVAGKHELETRDLEVAGFEGPLAGRLYRAAVDGRRDVLIVFFHGGGFVGGDLDEAAGFLHRLADASGYPVVLSSTYTLAPV